MLKKQSGVTLTVLIITVVVLLILASVIMSINMRLNKTVDLKEIQANMETIKIVASEYRTKYLDDETEDISGNIKISNNFVGEHCTSSNSSGEIISALLEYKGKIGKLSNYWFQLDSSNIDALGTDIKLKDDHMDTKIDAVKDKFDPRIKGLLKNLYGILSKSIHELDEDQSKEYYIYLKTVIDMQLEYMNSEEEKEKQSEYKRNQKPIVDMKYINEVCKRVEKEIKKNKFNVDYKNENRNQINDFTEL